MVHAAGRHGYNQDFLIDEAINRIWSTYGHKVSVQSKAKVLHKFGRTNNADNGVKTTVAVFQGTEVNETFATTNSIDSISSSSGSDTGEVTVEGHYFDGENNLVFHVQTATLAGQTEVTLSQSLCRATRIYRSAIGTVASPAAALVGNIYVYDSSVATTPAAGVPNDATATKCMIAAGKQQSEKCATSLSSQDYWILPEVYASLTRSTGANINVDVDIETRKLGGVWLPLGFEINLRSSSSSLFHDEMNPAFIIPPNTDIRMVATSDTNDTTVAGYMHGFLAIIT